MIHLRLKKLMLAKGISKPHGYLVKAGMGPSMATKLLSNLHKNLSLKHVEMLCWRLNCTPNELLEWEPDKIYPDTPNHALQQIRAQEIESNLPKLLKTLNKKQLEDLSRQALAMMVENQGGKKE